MFHTDRAAEAKKPKLRGVCFMLNGERGISVLSHLVWNFYPANAIHSVQLLSLAKLSPPQEDAVRFCLKYTLRLVQLKTHTPAHCVEGHAQLLPGHIPATHYSSRTTRPFHRQCLGDQRESQITRVGLTLGHTPLMHMGHQTLKANPPQQQASTLRSLPHMEEVENLPFET